MAGRGVSQHEAHARNLEQRQQHRRSERQSRPTLAKAHRPHHPHLRLHDDELALLRQQHQQRHGQALLGGVALHQCLEQRGARGPQAGIGAAVLTLQQAGDPWGHGGGRQWMWRGGRKEHNACMLAVRGTARHAALSSPA